MFETVARPLVFFVKQRGAALRERVGSLLHQEGLDPATSSPIASPLPGGQKQRICIARTSRHRRRMCLVAPAIPVHHMIHLLIGANIRIDLKIPADRI
ncbi:hypothetical protein BOTU111921_03310 [Bordetella tumbae]